MVQIIVDDSFTQQMAGTIVPCMVLNSEGKRIGYFTPEIDASVYRGVEPSVSEEELSRRERDGSGRTVAEIFQDLEQSGR